MQSSTQKSRPQIGPVRQWRDPAALTAAEMQFLAVFEGCDGSIAKTADILHVTPKIASRRRQTISEKVNVRSTEGLMNLWRAMNKDRK